MANDQRPEPTLPGGGFAAPVGHKLTGAFRRREAVTVLPYSIEDWPEEAKAFDEVCPCTRGRDERGFEAARKKAAKR